LARTRQHGKPRNDKQAKTNSLKRGSCIYHCAVSEREGRRGIKGEGWKRTKKNNIRGGARLLLGLFAANRKGNDQFEGKKGRPDARTKLGLNKKTTNDGMSSWHQKNQLLAGRRQNASQRECLVGLELAHSMAKVVDPTPKKSSSKDRRGI